MGRQTNVPLTHVTEDMAAPARPSTPYTCPSFAAAINSRYLTETIELTYLRVDNDNTLCPVRKWRMTGTKRIKGNNLVVKLHIRSCKR